MAYRDDVSALEARLASLQADVATAVRERDDAARLLEEARARAHAEAYLADLAAGGPARRRRQRMWIAAAVAGLVMLVGGVLAVRARHHDDRFETAMQKFAQFTDEMCQCRDAACAQHVSDDMTRWAQEVTKEWKPEPTLTGEQTKRAMDLGTRMGNCMQQAMSAPNADEIAR